MDLPAKMELGLDGNDNGTEDDVSSSNTATNGHNGHANGSGGGDTVMTGGEGDGATGSSS